MTDPTQTLQWSDALPTDFDFYHLGKIQAVSNENFRPLDSLFFDELLDKNIIAFHFYGTTRALLIFLFPKGLDASTYSEAGNILASRLATRWTLKHGIDLILSPPQNLLPNQLERVLSQQPTHPIQKKYLHVDGQNTIPLEVLLFPSTQETIGYA